jgi:alpha-glucosidase
LPAGATWFDWYTKERYQGGQVIEQEVSLGSIPMFLRSGAIIPMSEKLMNIHTDVIETLHLLIEPSEESEFVIYDDDGTSNNYKSGEYLKTSIKINRNNGTKITVTREGNYLTPVKIVIVDVICYDIAPIQICLQDCKLPMFLNRREWEVSNAGWYYDMEQKTAKIKYDNINENYEIHVDFNVKDLISV